MLGIIWMDYDVTTLKISFFIFIFFCDWFFSTLLILNFESIYFNISLWEGQFNVCEFNPLCLGVTNSSRIAKIRF